MSSPLARRSSTNDNRRYCVVVDVDGTLVIGETLRKFVRHNLSKYATPLLIELFTKAVAKRLIPAYSPNLGPLCLRGLSGMTSHDIEVLGSDFAEVILTRWAREQVLARIAWHKELGDFVCLATGAPDFYVRHLAKWLGIDGFVATRMAYDPDGVFRGQIEGEVCVGPEKARRVLGVAEKNGFSPETLVFYTDSAIDLPLIRQASFPVAICPDRKLARLCAANDWPVEHW